jgi:SAM-dependent methyltransferase
MTLKNLLKDQLRRRLIQPVVKAGYSASSIQHLAAIFPHKSDENTYTLPAYSGSEQQHQDSSFPIPPEPFWADYCTTVETYLQSGLDDTTTMRKLLEESGAPIENAGRILELGVAGGRMMRHLADLASSQEIWGVDVWASAILWCKENLSPPFYFATTTVTPHLPFEDRSFGLVFAGSVWTHLDDLAEAWALEAHRVLRPDGRLYFTINDRSAVKFFEGGGTPENRARYVERIRPKNWESWLNLLQGHAGYQRFAHGEAMMVTMGRSTRSHVMWDVDYLLKRWGPGWRVCSVTPEAYGHQTGVLLARI